MILHVWDWLSWGDKSWHKRFGKDFGYCKFQSVLRNCWHHQSFYLAIFRLLNEFSNVPQVELTSIKCRLAKPWQVICLYNCVMSAKPEQKQAKNKRKRGFKLEYQQLPSVCSFQQDWVTVDAPWHYRRKEKELWCKLKSNTLLETKKSLKEIPVLKKGTQLAEWHNSDFEKDFHC